MQTIFTTIEGVLDRHAPEEVLILFDVDHTLTVPEARAFHWPSFEQYSAVLDAIMSTMTDDQAMIMFCLAAFDGQHILIDECIPQKICDLQNKGVKVMALSAFVCCPLPNIPNPAILRYNDLKALGIDLSFHDHHDSIVFSNVPKSFGCHPELYKNVMGSNGEGGGNAKGETLIEFLNHEGQQKKAIILVDDKTKNLKGVEGALRDKDIEFIGIECIPGQKFTTGPITEEEFSQYWTYWRDQALDFMQNAA